MQKEWEHQHEGHTTREPHNTVHIHSHANGKSNFGELVQMSRCMRFSLSPCGSVSVYAFVYVLILWFDVLTLWKTIQLVPHSRQCLQNAIACVRRKAIYTQTHTVHAYQLANVCVCECEWFDCVSMRFYPLLLFLQWIVIRSKKCGCVHVCICSCATMQQHGWMWMEVSERTSCAPNPCAHHRFRSLFASSFVCLHIHCMWRAPVEWVLVLVSVSTRILRSLYFDIDYEWNFFLRIVNSRVDIVAEKSASAHTRVLDRVAPSLNWAWAIQAHSHTPVAQ